MSRAATAIVRAAASVSAVALVFFAAAPAAHAAEWGAWQKVSDTYQNGVDVRFREASVKNASGKPEVEYQLRNRYPQPVTVKIAFTGPSADAGGAAAQTLLSREIRLATGEQKTISAANPQRLVLQSVRLAYAVEIRFNDTAPPPATAGEPRLRELIRLKKRDVERLEREREQAELRAARVRTAIARPQGRFIDPDLLASLPNSADLSQAEQQARAASQRANDARRELTNLEEQLRQSGAPEAGAASAALAPLAAEAARLGAENNWADAEQAYLKMTRAEPSNALIRANLGVTQENQNKLSDAEASFREATRLEPNNAAFHENLGGVLLKRNKLADAEAAFTEAVRLSPSNARYQANLGIALTRRKKNAEAEAALREAVRLEPGVASFHTRLGVVLGQQKKWAEAESVLREAVRLEPNVARHHANLGLALVNGNKLAEAETAYREAARLDPNNAGYASSLKQVQDMRRVGGSGTKEP